MRIWSEGSLDGMEVWSWLNRLIIIDVEHLKAINSSEIAFYVVFVFRLCGCTSSSLSGSDRHCYWLLGNCCHQVTDPESCVS